LTRAKKNKNPLDAVIVIIINIINLAFWVVVIITKYVFVFFMKVAAVAASVTNSAVVQT
jgi:hypothetical protein